MTILHSALTAAKAVLGLSWKAVSAIALGVWFLVKLYFKGMLWIGAAAFSIFMFLSCQE